MKWSSAISTRPSLEAAIDDAVLQAQRSLGLSADLGFVFISNTFASEYPRLMPLLRERLNCPHILGCGGRGVIGQGEVNASSEVEGAPALALTLAHLPQVKIQPFHIAADQLPDLDSPPKEWVELTGVDPQDQPHFIVLADAMTSRISDLLRGLDFAYPQAVKIGGLTSGISSLAAGGLFCDYRLYGEGTIGFALSGNIDVDTIVAQGCRPVGPLLRVVESDKHVMLKVESVASALGSETITVDTKPQTALEALHQALDNMNDLDRTMAQNALSIGIVRDEFQSRQGTGDFLIRNLIGVDPRLGALAIGDRIRPGQHVQFHLRDAQSSSEDLQKHLARYIAQPRPTDVEGIMLFDCLGRGERFYGQPNFDTHLIEQHLPNTAIGGFFCDGEIGPVGNATFLHGYTAALGLFRPKHPAAP